MTQKVDGNLNAFQRRHTELRIPELPTHCMSGQYQNLHPRSWPFPGLPSRYLTPLDEDDPTVIDFSDEPVDTEDRTIPGGVSRVTRERHSEYAKHHEGGHRFLIDLLHETREQVLDLLERHGPVYLERHIENLTARLENRAAAIDEEYLVVKSRSAEEIEYFLDQMRQHPNSAPMYEVSGEKRSTRIREAQALLSLLQKSSHHRPGALLQDVLPDLATTGECRWRLDTDLSPSISMVASYTKQAGFNFLKPLKRPRETRCVSLPALGYQCGISHLPVDLTLDQAELILELYYTDLKNRADRICETHALLYFRAWMADVILQEYNLYGEAKRRSREDVKEDLRNVSSAKMGRPIHAADDKTMEDRRDPLVAALNNRDHWHTNGPHRGKPKWETIANHLAANHPNLFMDQKKHGLPLLARSIAAIARDRLEIDLDSIRKRLGIPGPR